MLKMINKNSNSYDKKLIRNGTYLSRKISEKVEDDSKINAVKSTLKRKQINRRAYSK